MQCSGRAEKPVSGGSHPEKGRWKMAGESHPGNCSGRTEMWRCAT